MGRFHTISVGPSTVTAAVDLFEILAASGKPFLLHEIVINQSSDYGDAAAEGLTITLKRATGSYTSGSSGGSPTSGKHLTNDAALGATVEALNTSQATAGSGAITIIRGESFNIQAGYQYFPAPEQRIMFLPSEALILSMTAPADSITLTGSVVIEEF